MLGSIFLSLAFACALISMIAYGMVLRGSDDRFLKIARASFHVTVVSFMLAAATLMYLIVTHQFQYTYIWEHSSTNLSTPLLMASFYAGQQGSFMLWTLWVSLIGVLVLGFAQRVKYEPAVMTIYMLVLACLLMILVVKSPFETIFQSFPDQNIPAGFVPQTGKGLNPSLENIWITIHPPILFTGFAAMTVPFVFAMAGLIKRDYQRWISISLPWALFASMVLGFGIMLGGWWAYETLGWGGFWAWDPVENSSLIPWLVCVAMVHTMLVQKRTGDTTKSVGGIGALVKTNFVLAITAFALILYSTFLTRSGILGDTSVHSFVAPGNFVYAVLLGIIILFVGLGVGVLVWRWKDLRLAALEMKLMSRESALGIGSAVVLASAFVVFAGTTAPIFMPLFNMPKIALQQDFYNNLHLPIALAIVLMNAIGMTLKWKNTTPDEFLKKMTVALGITCLGTVGLALLGITDPLYLGLGFGALLALIVNLQVGLKVIKGNRRFVGAYVSHAGVSILLLGIIFTSRYSVTDHVRLIEGEKASVFGYDMTYKGAERVDMEKVDRERYRHLVVLEKGGSKYEVRPVIFWSDFNNRESAFMEPGILYSFSKDIYISPKGIQQVGGDPTAQLHKGDKVPLPFDSSITVKFDKFDMSRAAGEGMQGAVMEVATKDSTYYLTSYYTMKDGRYLPVDVPGTDVSIGMGGLNADKENLSNSEVILVFKSASHPPGPTKNQITLDVSIKPFISLVWAGVIIMVGGFFFAMLRRRKEVDLHVRPESTGGIIPNNGSANGGAKKRIESAEPQIEPIAAATATRR